MTQVGRTHSRHAGIITSLFDFDPFDYVASIYTLPRKGQQSCSPMLKYSPTLLLRNDVINVIDNVLAVVLSLWV